jgi:hypothetical protein
VVIAVVIDDKALASGRGFNSLIITFFLIENSPWTVSRNSWWIPGEFLVHPHRAIPEEQPGILVPIPSLQGFLEDSSRNPLGLEVTRNDHFSGHWLEQNSW